ncbi:MAG: SdpI family protein, partial [Candidatus Absconditabacteria bacterium]
TGLYLRVGMVLFMFLIYTMIFDYMPEQMPIHWGINGNADGFASKNVALLMLPILSTILFLFFEIVPFLDPRKAMYKKFDGAWENLKNYIICFFLYLYFVTIFLSVTPSFSMNFFMMFGLGMLFILMGKSMSQIKSNYFIGIRTPWSLENEEVWGKTHRVASWVFVLGGGVLLLSAFFGFHPMYIFIFVILTVTLIPLVYSYYLYSKITNSKK